MVKFSKDSQNIDSKISHENLNKFSNELPAEFYDIIFPFDSEEYNFYKYFLNLKPGRALELGCGTGNLLLKYRQEGFFIDGIDHSQSMFNICEKKMKIFDLGKQYLQDMRNLKLDSSYTTIYAPACVFMLIPEYDQSIKALKNFYEHLEPNGQLIISLFLPFNELSFETSLKNSFYLWKDFFVNNENNTPKILSENISEKENKETKNQNENSNKENRVLIYESLKYEPLEQLRKGLYKLEIYKNNKLEETQVYEKIWRWYGVQEFKNILTNVGFKNIELYGDFTLERASNNNFVIIFKAFK